MIDTLEENSYFKIVVKDAISDLKHNGSAFVFFQEQVDLYVYIFHNTFYCVHLFLKEYKCTTIMF